MTGQIISSEVSRRALLTGGLAGGFLLALHVPVREVNEPVEPPDETAGKFAPNAFIRIEHSGKTTLVMPQVEMGQGTYTSIPMILAEELDADFSKVTLEHAPPNDRLYANPMLGYQVTGNSSSIRSFWQPLRSAGAAARTMLILAAAQWSVEPTSCTAANGEVVHAETGRRLSYGSLVDAANTQVPPKDVRLKAPHEFVLIGRPLKRLDTPDKVNGKAVYGIDAMIPGMKFALLKACPVFGGKVGRVDDSAVRKISGVQKVVVRTGT
ncbi:MAG: xanthine dehydrogenase family protein molybdopterin-binding subunit [Hyphomicrobiales bacterium]|nr:xanthine dehydrogenase family protein molybdopterin-binding subunit [Hyphomicrobiales bacterium]